MSDGFYKAFEDKYRGPRELIKSRQRVYLPFIEPLRTLYAEPTALDLGCGRGEWLELLHEAGFDATGVDLDEDMLQSCRELGFKVQAHDAISWLKALPAESQVVVSGFHLAEHLPFSDLQTLVQEALRVLKPAGLLILETPNPENMAVGSCSFYLDPTHQRPIPPQLLSFLPEHYGFVKAKVVRLQEDKALLGDSWISLRDVLTGVSPDYAVVAQKSADAALLSCNDNAFAQEYGLTLDSLAEKFHLQIQRALQDVETQAQLAQERAAQAEAQAQLAQKRATHAEAQAQLAQKQTTHAEAQAQLAQERAAHAEAQAQLAQKQTTHAEAQAQLAQKQTTHAEAQAQLAQERAAHAEAQAQLSQERASQVEIELNALHRSRSWRITAPLRWVNAHVSALASGQSRSIAISIAKHAVKPIVGRVLSVANKHPRFRSLGIAALSKVGLLEPARRLHVRLAPNTGTGLRGQGVDHTEQPWLHLAPAAVAIHEELQVAIKAKNKAIDN